MTTRAILYDAGGTLIRSTPALTGIHALVAARYPNTPAIEDVGMALPDPVYFFYIYPMNDPSVPWQVHSDEAFRASAAEFYAGAFKRAGLLADEDDLRDLLRQAHDHTWHPDTWSLYPETIDVLVEGKQRGLIQGVISDAASAMAGLLDGLGLSQYLDFVVISATMGLSKPDATIFDMALQRAKVDAAQALYVGDNYMPDVLGARSAGLPVLLIDRHGPYTRRPPVVDVPVIESLREIWEYVE